jgi:hypothetical protein
MFIQKIHILALCFSFFSPCRFFINGSKQQLNVEIMERILKGADIFDSGSI